MDFPKIDFSKAPHPSLVNSLLLFVPGLFLELIVAIGNPGFASDVLAHLPSTNGPGGLLTTAIVLFIALVLGGIADSWTRALRMLLSFFYRTYVQLRTRLFRWARRKPPQPKKRSMPDIQRRLLEWSAKVSSKEEELRSAGLIAWTKIASRVLKERYGITSPDNFRSAPEWRVWFDILGSPGIPELRGDSLQRTLEAVGWYALVALHFAPSLKNLYFLLPAVLLILLGLYHEWIVVKRFTNEAWIIGSRILTLLKEFPPIQGAKNGPESDK